MKPRLTVCVVSWNAKDDLFDCLQSLRVASARPGSVRVVVADNDSRDGSPELTEADFPEVTLIRTGANLGFSGGNNVVLKQLETDYVLLLNSDATVEPNGLDALIDFADANPDAGAIGPKVINPDGSIQYSCRRWPTFAAGIFRNVYLGKLFPGNRPASDYLMQDFDHNSVRDVDWLSGCALLLRKDLLDRIGLLDEETFFMYCEDMDICLRAHEAESRVVYFPGTVVTHAIGKSSDRAADRMIWEHSRSMWKFYRKHRIFFAGRVPLILKPFIYPGIFLRAAVRIGRRRLINPLLGGNPRP